MLSSIIPSSLGRLPAGKHCSQPKGLVTLFLRQGVGQSCASPAASSEWNVGVPVPKVPVPPCFWASLGKASGVCVGRQRRDQHSGRLAPSWVGAAPWAASSALAEWDSVSPKASVLSIRAVTARPASLCPCPTRGSVSLCHPEKKVHDHLPPSPAEEVSMLGSVRAETELSGGGGQSAQAAELGGGGFQQQHSFG